MLIGGPPSGQGAPALAATPSPTASTSESAGAGTTPSSPSTPDQSREAGEPRVSTAEGWAAALAILGGIVLGAGVLWLVKRAHDLQRDLAGRAAAAGMPVSVTVASAAAPFESAGTSASSTPTLELSGPDRLPVGRAAEFVVRGSSAEPEWTVRGLDAYELRKPDPRTLVLTPRTVQSDAAVAVSDGGMTVVKPVQIEPAADDAGGDSFTVRLVVRSWGLVLVAIVVVFGATALGLTGHLDGGNFVALVAPLAALLGVTAVTSAGGGGSSTPDA